MDEIYEIPSAPEVAHAQRETHVKLTMEVTGGAIVDGQAIVFEFDRIVLTQPGQLKIKIRDRSEDDWLSIDTWPPPRDLRMDLQIENAALRQAEPQDSTHTMRVVDTE